MFKNTTILLGVFAFSAVGTWGSFKKPSAFKDEFSPERCGLPRANEISNIIKVSPGFKTPEELGVLSQKVYNSSRRLGNRAWYDPTTHKFYAYFLKEKISIPIRLIKSVTTHIETVLGMGYAEEIILSDMGHAHMLIPLDVYHASDRSVGVGQFLSFFYGHPRTKFLYHTAERLKIWNEDGSLIPNRYLQKRFFTRNVVADNSGSSEIHFVQNPSNAYNTVTSYPGHRYISGFDISANKGGCFPFYDKNNKLRYFDISPMGHYPIGHHPDIPLPAYQDDP